MEKLEQIHQTIADIDARVPDALRIALGLGYRVSPTPAPGEDDEVADFAASLLQPPPPPPSTEYGAGAGAGAGAGDCGPTEPDDNEVVDCAASPLQPPPETVDAADAARADADDRGPTEQQPDTAAAASAPPRIDWASCYVPLHDHDAHFGNAEAGVVGVADGVGAYADDGVDAGAFSRGLMTSAAAAAALEPGARAGPRALLQRAYDETAASGAPGASTAVILSLAAGGGALDWAYIGDSAFAVLRDGRIAFLSTPQRHLSRTTRAKIHFASSAAGLKQHLFCSKDPPFQLSAKAANSDRVADAKSGQLAVRTGDVVVVGTDGLFDNILEEQLELAVRMGTRLGFSPKNMADIIAGVAYERSNQTTSRRLRKGKPDDITVLVVFIVQSDL